MGWGGVLEDEKKTCSGCMRYAVDTPGLYRLVQFAEQEREYRVCPNHFFAHAPRWGRPKSRKKPYFSCMEPNDTIKAQLLDARDLERTLHRMARQLVEMFALEIGRAHV